MLRRVLFAWVLLAFASGAWAQVATDAVITGTVIDSTQRAIQWAKVSVTKIRDGPGNSSRDEQSWRVPHSSTSHWRLYVVNIEATDSRSI